MGKEFRQNDKKYSCFTKVVDKTLQLNYNEHGSLNMIRHKAFVEFDFGDLVDLKLCAPITKGGK